MSPLRTSHVEHALCVCMASHSRLSLPIISLVTERHLYKPFSMYFRPNRGRDTHYLAMASKGGHQDRDNEARLQRDRDRVGKKEQTNT